LGLTVTFGEIASVNTAIGDFAVTASVIYLAIRTTLNTQHTHAHPSGRDGTYHCGAD
jgi:hypothetical protein